MSFENFRQNFWRNANQIDIGSESRAVIVPLELAQQRVNFKKSLFGGQNRSSVILKFKKKPHLVKYLKRILISYLERLQFVEQ